MKGSNNAFTPDSNVLAALTGKGDVPLINPTYAATVQFDPKLGPFQQFLLTGAMTLNAGTLVGKPGQIIIFEFKSDATGRTVTFGTGFRSVTATLAGTASKSMMFAVVSNGVSWMELFRTAAIT